MDKIRLAQGPLGNFFIPRKTDFKSEYEADSTEATYEIFEKYSNFHVNEPLGPVSEEAAEIPFSVSRTKTSNLPVYTDYKQGSMRQRTIIRNITGDFPKFKEELSKVVSNSPMEEKMGRVEIKGLHS